jgi:hypothetical protein
VSVSLQAQGAYLRTRGLGPDFDWASLLAESTFQAWMGEEDSFLADERPWERADLVVAGTPELPHDPRTELLVADGHLR